MAVLSASQLFHSPCGLGCGPRSPVRGASRAFSDTEQVLSQLRAIGNLLTCVLEFSVLDGLRVGLSGGTACRGFSLRKLRDFHEVTRFCCCLGTKLLQLTY